MAPTFLLLYVITNEKTVKLMQIDRLTARLILQKHIPITLVGIPYLVSYTLSDSAGELNARVGNEVMKERIIGRYGVSRKNARSETSLPMCAQHELEVRRKYCIVKIYVSRHVVEKGRRKSD